MTGAWKAVEGHGRLWKSSSEAATFHDQPRFVTHQRMDRHLRPMPGLHWPSISFCNISILQTNATERLHAWEFLTFTRLQSNVFLACWSPLLQSLEQPAPAAIGLGSERPVRNYCESGQYEQAVDGQSIGLKWRCITPLISTGDWCG